MKTEFLSEIAELLRRQVDVCRRLLALLQAERQALLFTRLPEMRELSHKKEALLNQGRELEERRLVLAARWASLFGLAPESMTLGTMASLSEAGPAAELHRRRSELRALLARLQEENQRNQAFCRRGLEVLKGAYQHLQKLATGDAVYHRTGQLQAARLSGRLLCNEI